MNKNIYTFVYEKIKCNVHLKKYIINVYILVVRDYKYFRYHLIGNFSMKIFMKLKIIILIVISVRMELL